MADSSIHYFITAITWHSVLPCHSKKEFTANLLPLHSTFCHFTHFVNWCVNMFQLLVLVQGIRSICKILEQQNWKLKSDIATSLPWRQAGSGMLGFKQQILGIATSLNFVDLPHNLSSFWWIVVGVAGLVEQHWWMQVFLRRLTRLTPRIWHRHLICEIRACPCPHLEGAST